MSETLAELEKQAAEIKKKIDQIKSQSDPEVDRILEEMSRPGTYVKAGGSWIINPIGKYRQPTHRSVEFRGQWIIFYPNTIPTLMDWTSGGYENKEFKRRISCGDIKLYHKPTALMEYLKQQVNNLTTDDIGVLQQMIEHCQVDPTFTWDPGKMLKYKYTKLCTVIVSQFDGLVFKKTFEDDRNEYYVFRVVDLGDGSYMVRMTEIRSYFDGRRLPDIVENSLLTTIRLKTVDPSVLQDLAMAVKQYLGGTVLGSEYDIKKVCSSCKELVEMSLSKVVKTIEDAIKIK